MCYCDLGAAVSLGQTFNRLLKVPSQPGVWGKVMKKSRMEGLEEVLLLMAQMIEFCDLAPDAEPMLIDLRASIYARLPASVPASQN